MRDSSFTFTAVLYPYCQTLIYLSKMKLTAFLLMSLLASVSTYSQVAGSCPDNIDFENGSFNNWQCYIGSTDTANGQHVDMLTASAPTANRHEIISSQSLPLVDPYGNFPRLCPNGGNYSVKLGNNGTGKQAEEISYSFQVPPGVDTFTLTYYYAVVFENPGHSDIEQPRFFVKAFDVATGALINCASYAFVATGNIPGFQVSAANPDVLYKNWTPVSIAFTGLAGKTVELEFRTSDCTRGGHFGYAYVDVASGCSGAIATAAYCIGSNQVTLNAPFGFQSYTWYNDNYSAVIGNQQILNLTPPPPVNSVFHVDMIPYPGYGCRDTAEAIVKLLPIPDTPIAQTNYDYCQGQTAAALTATPISGNSLYWYTSATGGVAASIAPVPSTLVPGTLHFYVSQKELFGCESQRKEINVVIKPIPDASFTINNPRQCMVGNHFIFTGVLADNISYTWDFGDGQTSNLVATDHVYTSYGNLVVKLKALNPPACFKEITKPVFIIPSPQADMHYPALICGNQTGIQLTDNSSVPGAVSTINHWYWNINGSVVNIQNPASFFASAGQLPIKLSVSTVEGCLSDTQSLILPVHYLPVAKFRFNDVPLCDNENILFTDQSYLPAAALQESVTKWNWKFDNGINSSVQHPVVNFSSGSFHAKLIAASNFGCTSNQADSSFIIYQKPSIGLNITDSCINRSIQYTAIDKSNSVAGWFWNFGSGLYANPAVITRSYTGPGYKPFILIGQTIRSCRDTIVRAFTIYSLGISAGNDTVTAMNAPVQLLATPTTTIAKYIWTPATGLNNATIQAPIATYDRDLLYTLKAFSDKGCDASAKVLVRRYKGPQLYIATAFTPNEDGLNDLLNVFPVGIKTFISFSVFNRGGQLIFSTTDYHNGWNGMFRGAKCDIGNYVVMAKAIDYLGKEMFVKQNVLLMR
jgi:gliding motility-associated-like protein